MRRCGNLEFVKRGKLKAKRSLVEQEEVEGTTEMEPEVGVEGEEFTQEEGPVLDVPAEEKLTFEDFAETVKSLSDLIHNAVNDIVNVVLSVENMKDIELDNADEVIAGLKQKIHGSLNILETCVEQLIYLLGYDEELDASLEDEDFEEMEEEEFFEEEEELEEMEEPSKED